MSNQLPRGLITGLIATTLLIGTGAGQAFASADTAAATATNAANRTAIGEITSAALANSSSHRSAKTPSSTPAPQAKTLVPRALPAAPSGRSRPGAGLHTDRIKVTAKKRLLTARIQWDRKLLGKVSNRDRFRARVIAIPAKSKPEPLIDLRIATPSSSAQSLKLKLSRKEFNKAKNAASVILSISQHHPAARSARFTTTYVSTTHLELASLHTGSTGATRYRAGRDCSTIAIGPRAKLAGCDLVGANLSNADLRGADLSHAHLAGAILKGARLARANITGTDFRYARGLNLKGTRIDTTTPAYAYWSTSGGTILSAPLTAGTGVPFCSNACTVVASGLQAPRDVEVDGSYVYWADQQANAIGRASLSGSDVQATWITGSAVNGPYGITVTDSNIYWTNAGGSIGTASIAGASPATLQQVGGTPTGLTTDGENIYWSDFINNTIGTLPLSNPSAFSRQFVPTSNAINRPSSLALGGGYLYWNNSASDTGAFSIGYVPVASPTATPTTIPTANNPLGVAASNEYVYWTQLSAGVPQLGSSGLTGQAPSSLSTSATTGYGMAVTPNQYPTLTIANITPDTGLIGQANPVTISGTNFDLATTATIGGLPCTAPIEDNGITLQCSVTSANTGTYDITVVNSLGQTATLAGGYSVLDTPAFSQTNPVAPNFAVINTNAIIRIQGQRFVIGSGVSDSATVTIGGTNCSIDIGQSSATQIVCTIAATHSAVQAANVVVTNPDGQSATLTNGFNFTLPPPVIAGTNPVQPSSGSATATTPVTITGQDFQNGADVYFINHSNPCTGVAVNGAGTQITCTAPANRAGSAAVTVVNPDDQSATADKGFTYLPPNPTIESVTPAAGSTIGNQVITIKGDYFANGPDLAVTVGGNPCKIAWVNAPKKIGCVTPAGSTVGNATVIVTNPNGQTVSAASDFAYALPAPVITGVSPAFGSDTGGAQVQLSGSGFLDSTSVTFGTNACISVDASNDGTTLTCTTPPGQDGPVDIAVSNGGLSQTLPGGYVYGQETWAYYINGQSIGRVSLDGTVTQPNLITGLSGPKGIAIDDQYVYWTNSASDTLGRANLDGQSVNNNFVTGASTPYGVVVTSTAIYWANSQGHSIGTAPITGGTATTAIDTGNNTYPSSIAVNSDDVYWGDTYWDRIGYASLSTPATVTHDFVTGGSIDDPFGLTVANGNLYWSNAGNPSSTVQSVALSNPGAVNNSIPTGPNPTSLSTDQAHIYWSESSNLIGYAGFGGANPATLASGASDLLAIAVQTDQSPAPAITGLNTSTGSSAGGTSLTLTGTGFQAGMSVTVGGVGCTVAGSITPTTVTCTTGAHAAASVDVVVVNPDLAVFTSSAAFTYTNPVPTITSITPATSALSGGGQVTITGTGYAAGTSVSIGSGNCTNVIETADGNSLTCDIPATGAPGTVGVTVTAPGAAAVTDNNAFTYLPNEQLFWADNIKGACSSGEGTIGLADAAGSGSVNQCYVDDSTESFLFNPSGVAVTQVAGVTYVYWADEGLGIIGRATVGATSSSVQVLVNCISLYADCTPTGLAISGSTIYWSDMNGYIGSANLDGTNANPQWFNTSTGNPGSSPSGLFAANNNELYWSDAGSNTLGVVNTSGQNANPSLVTVPASPMGVAVDSTNTYIYWANDPGSKSEADGSIGRTTLADPQGSNYSATWINNVVQPHGVTVDSNFIYWTSGPLGAGNGGIGRAPLSDPASDTQTQFRTGANDPYGVTTWEIP